MDPLRQLRFVIPPLFLYGSLLVGELLSLDLASADKLVESLNKLQLLPLAAIGAALGALAFPLGWLLGAMGIAVIRLLAMAITLIMRSKVRPVVQLNETWLRSETWEKLAKFFGEDTPESIFVYRLQALATFDHGHLHPGVGDWIQRRWNSFHLSLHAVSALLLALPVGHGFGIPLNGPWLLGTIICVLVLAFHSGVAYWETMRMFEFQIDHPTLAESAQGDMDQRRRSKGLPKNPRRNPQ